jgi:hypothetical protein
LVDGCEPCAAAASPDANGVAASNRQTVSDLSMVSGGNYMRTAPAARGESPAAFERRCIPPGCVAPPSNIPDILGRRALPAGRLAVLGATPDFHHGLLAACARCSPAELDDVLPRQPRNDAIECEPLCLDLRPGFCDAHPVRIGDRDTGVFLAVLHQDQSSAWLQ